MEFRNEYRAIVRTQKPLVNICSVVQAQTAPAFKAVGDRHPLFMTALAAIHTAKLVTDRTNRKTCFSCCAKHAPFSKLWLLVTASRTLLSRAYLEIFMSLLGMGGLEECDFGSFFVPIFNDTLAIPGYQSVASRS